MQWTSEDLNKWEELRPYVDTALLPIYFYQSAVAIPTHALQMAYLTNIAAALERRLKGRMLLYPLRYQMAEEQAELMAPDAFPFYVVLHFGGQPVRVRSVNEASKVAYLAISNEELDSELRFAITVDVLYQEILALWQKR
ncbi:DUF2487 family protein [Brevibacillus fulvus]|uniref:DUF2487 domain-containing protein n=1 Tax=Brevibacillus fulvus TaxID=1125967 RepID=A0A938XW14_9BACL|nr:DUF2487 family protein [Brevibacillus fulvus]MBM7588733.1 hypothetical protein [Brevibacillus fulvus]